MRRHDGWLRGLLERLWLRPGRRAADGTSPHPSQSGDWRYAPRPSAGVSDGQALRFGETFDLLLLVSCLPAWLHNWLIAALQPLAARYAPQRQTDGVAALLRANVLLPNDGQDRAGWLRRKLCAELAGGLSLAATPPGQLSRPARNRALMARAEAIGQVAEELRRRPGAAPLEQELARALAELRG